MKRDDDEEARALALELEELCMAYTRIADPLIRRVVLHFVQGSADNLVPAREKAAQREDEEHDDDQKGQQH